MLVFILIHNTHIELLWFLFDCNSNNCCLIIDVNVELIKKGGTKQLVINYIIIFLAFFFYKYRN